MQNNKQLILLKSDLEDTILKLLSDCLIELTSSIEHFELDIIITSAKGSNKLLKMLLWFIQTLDYNCIVRVFYNFNLDEQEYYKIEEEFMNTLELHTLNDLYGCNLLDYSSKIKTEEYIKVRVISNKQYSVYLPAVYNPELEI
ncbi:MAG: hypothetical protein J5691_00495 [Bacilli bacterium]|nr:hypothetical protein [Bacilli bacterium]